MPEDCRCLIHCKNQRYATSFFASSPSPQCATRFQRKQYAPIDIILTEKKGFGLRAAGNLSRFVFFPLFTVFLTFTFFCRSHRDTFIYEYVGDVVSSPSMKKRMRDYGKEGIQHFYFMMLQKDEVCPGSRLSFMSAKRRRVVHRRDQEGRDRAIRKPQLQPQLLCREVDHRGQGANGNICQEGHFEGRGADVQL